MTLDTEIRDQRDARYASHVPVLRAWLAGRQWQIIEFGCGRFSTPVLVEYAETLTCFEKSGNWRQEVKEAVPSADMREVPTELQGFQNAFSQTITPDHFVFVDGAPGQWRIHAIQCAQQKSARLIIAHDWSDTQVGYGYHLLEDHASYQKHVYRCQQTKVRTAAFTYVPTVEGSILCT